MRLAKFFLQAANFIFRRNILAQCKPKKIFFKPHFPTTTLFYCGTVTIAYSKKNRKEAATHVEASSTMKT